jgi:phosphatidylinositol glycan class O
VEAAWLRRHLMLYRVFMPRMLLAIVSLLLVEVVGALVALVGVRWSMVSVGDVLGWPDVSPA